MLKLVVTISWRPHLIGVNMKILIYKLINMIRELISKQFGYLVDMHNGIYYTYVDVWFDTGDGYDSYEKQYIQCRYILGLWFLMHWDRVLKYRLPFSIHINENTKLWWSGALLEMAQDIDPSWEVHNSSSIPGYLTCLIYDNVDWESDDLDWESECPF